MVTYRTPDVYVEEVPSGARSLERQGTSTCGFVGEAPDPQARLNEAVAINNWSEFQRLFTTENSTGTALSNAVFGFFQNGGTRCYVVNVGSGQTVGDGNRVRAGLALFETIDEIAIVACPGYTDASSYEEVLSHCEKLQDRVGILDAPYPVENIDLLTQAGTVQSSRIQRRRTETPGGEGESEGASEADAPAIPPAASAAGARQSEYGTYYFPWIIARDSLPPYELIEMPPSGHVAGIWARSDATRGVHKAPANEPIRGALGLTYRLTRDELGMLNQAGVNCIRFFTTEGIRLWGARTLAGSSSQWRYLNVRRLFNMIKESIADGTRWIVYEPNDITLWKSIRRDISAFLVGLWRDGALMGRTPEQAFFVKCDEETNPQDSIDAGMVITLIGIAPVKPAEFVVFRISQYDGGSDVEMLGG